jgi:hypothetical protein
MTDPNVGRMMTPWEQFWSNARGRLIRFRRKLPYLVWYGDELDVRVTFFDDALQEDHDIEGGLRQFQSGELHTIQRRLNELGITFDSGMGAAGRDWEWDWSLKGPISVTFRRRCQNPQYRASLHTLNKVMAEIRAKMGAPKP